MRALWNLIFDPSAPATIVYAGRCSGGALYKSSDGGTTWSKENEGLTGVVPRGLGC